MTISQNDLSRRGFIQQVGAGALGLATASLAIPAAEAQPQPMSLQKLSDHLYVYSGPINVGIVREGDKALLIDCGDDSVRRALADAGITSVETVLFTHHHRDQACGVHGLVADGVRVVVPDAERNCFEHVEDYWNKPKNRWHVYNFHPHHLMLGESVRADATVKDGDEWNWGPARIRALATPGHTDGSMSFMIETDGRRVVFSGDLIYDEGQIWDIHSLQKGFRRGKTTITDYHGFLGARTELAESLKRIADMDPDALVPSHGNIMNHPRRAMDTLRQRLDTCYDKYVSISALRHYFPELFAEYAGRTDHMAIRSGKQPPPYVRQFKTTWMVVSESKDAFVMDCWNGDVVQHVKTLQQQGDIRSVEALWVTHYHDDHTNGIPEFLKTFKCPCITDHSVAQIISDPLAWRLPCVSPNRTVVDRVTHDGESWQWREFKMTAYYFPGQTLYHAGLLVEGRGARMLFVGDSFTMAGIDDYCTYNRNWLGHDVGFDRCIALVEKLEPTHLFNCHVAEAFDFTPEQCRFMRANLAQREELFGQLVPWDHANYGTDEPWVRCAPYEQHARPGQMIELETVITNHSAEPRTACCRATLPRSWSPVADGAEETPQRQHPNTATWMKTDIPKKTEGKVVLTIQVPDHVRPGRYVIPVDVRYGSRSLPQFTEAIVVI